MQRRDYATVGNFSSAVLSAPAREAQRVSWADGLPLVLAVLALSLVDSRVSAEGEGATPSPAEAETTPETPVGARASSEPARWKVDLREEQARIEELHRRLYGELGPQFARAASDLAAATADFREKAKRSPEGFREARVALLEKAARTSFPSRRGWRRSLASAIGRSRTRS